MHLPLPEITRTASGEIRRVGFEIEFAGIEPDKGVEMIRQVVGGDIKKTSPFCLEVGNTRYGTFLFEVDAAFLKDEKYKEYARKAGIEIDDLDNSESLENILRDVAITVVPCEIVMPPIPVDEIDIVNGLVDALRNKKAKGTGKSMLYAFGLHINVEAVESGAGYLLNHIRAFTLLYDWICEKTGVDLSRRITPYINRYPDKYTQLIMDPDYQPPVDTLIRDYLKLVHSRNHALDMLPLFASLSEDTVMQHAAEPSLIKPRPAFHYRLANSRIDEPGWSIANEWHYWLQIENLANDITLLDTLMQEYRKHHSSLLPASQSVWIEKIDSSLG